MWSGTVRENQPCVSLLAEGASGICKHLRLKDGFKKFLSISGEVGLLAGDRVVSHE